MILLLPCNDNLVKATTLLVMNPKFDKIQTVEDVQNVFVEKLSMEGVRVREISGNIVQDSN